MSYVPPKLADDFARDGADRRTNDPPRPSAAPASPRRSSSFYHRRERSHALLPPPPPKPRKVVRSLPTYAQAPQEPAAAAAAVATATPAAAAVQQPPDGPMPTEEIDLFVRRSRCAAENGMSYNELAAAWPGKKKDPKSHFFYPNGAVRWVTTVDVWKPLVRAYFGWFAIPRSECTSVWGDIVDGLLAIESRFPDKPLSPEFSAWAYACLCKFYLQDRKKALATVEYDPDHPGMSE